MTAIDDTDVIKCSHCGVLFDPPYSADRYDFEGKLLTNELKQKLKYFEVDRYYRYKCPACGKLTSKQQY